MVERIRRGERLGVICENAYKAAEMCDRVADGLPEGRNYRTAGDRRVVVDGGGFALFHGRRTARHWIRGKQLDAVVLVGCRLTSEDRDTVMPALLSSGGELVEIVGPGFGG